MAGGRCAYFFGKCRVMRRGSKYLGAAEVQEEVYDLACVGGILSIVKPRSDTQCFAFCCQEPFSREKTWIEPIATSGGRN